MKQKIFTLIMMLALVIVAGSAFALNEATVLPGGLYYYRVSNIAVSGAATVTVDYEPSGAVDATVAGLSPASYIGAVTGDSIKFSVEYGTEIAGSDDGNIRVTVTETATGCSNYILYAINVTAPPTWSLTISSDQTDDDYGCQQPLATAPTTGLADAYTGGDNTIVFSVAAGASAPAGTPTYSYTIGVSGATCLTCDAGNTSGDDYPATFTSTEGAGFNVTGTISGTFTMDAAHGGGTYPMTPNGPLDVNVDALPTIGAFN